MESLKDKFTEEEFNCLLNKFVQTTGSVDLSDIENIKATIEIDVGGTIKELKRIGIIKQNPVEKANELYKKLSSMDYLMIHKCELYESIDDFHEAIEYLENQIGEKQ